MNKKLWWKIRIRPDINEYIAILMDGKVVDSGAVYPTYDSMLDAIEEISDMCGLDTVNVVNAIVDKTAIVNDDTETVTPIRGEYFFNEL